MKPTKEQLIHWIEYMQWNMENGYYRCCGDDGKTEKEVIEFLLLMLPLFLEDSDDGIIYTYKEEEYEVELKKQLWSYLLNVTHAGLMRQAQETIVLSGLFHRVDEILPFEHLAELKQVIQDYESTHDMEEYKRILKEVKDEHTD